MGPALGFRLVLVGQAVVFGAAHAGSDYVASAIPVVLVIATGGLLAGLIVRRTGSLPLPIVMHICFGVPLYYAAVWRAVEPERDCDAAYPRRAFHGGAEVAPDGSI